MTFRLRRALLAAMLVAGPIGFVARSAPPAEAKSANPGCSAPLSCGDDLKTAVDREAKAYDHLRYGKLVPVGFANAKRRPGQVVGTGGWGDSGLWTGVYQGGQAMRYATAKRYLATGRLSAGQVRFWTAQRDDALSKLRTILDGQHRDVHIAASWRTEPKVPPTVTPGEDRVLDFGGGVQQGEAGMLQRSCTPTDAPPGLGISKNPRVFGPFPWTDGKEYICEGSPSRDTYAGVIFGLLTTFDLVGVDHPEIADQIRADLFTMADFLVRHGWNYVRPHGYVATSHDFDGFVSPLFVYVPAARLNMANAARHVAAAGGTADEQLKWNALWAEELATQGPLLAASMEVDALQPNDGYYKFNLHHLNFFNLLRTNAGPVRDLFAQAFAVMDKTTGDDVNAHFEAISYSITGESARLDAAVTHLREWRQYKAYVETGAARVNSTRCGTEITCVPKDQYEVDDVTWFPGQPDVQPVSSSAGLRAARPLPVELRAPSDFIWQRTPTQLDGQEGPEHREPAIDYLTPYWMLRYLTETAPPALAPLPAYPGPAHA